MYPQCVFVERKNYARICVLYMNTSDKHLVTLMRGGVGNDAYGKRDFRAWKYDEIIIAQRIFRHARSSECGQIEVALFARNEMSSHATFRFPKSLAREKEGSWRR